VIPDKSGRILSIPALPPTLSPGTYTFYAIPVLEGRNVDDAFQWIGDLAKQEMRVNR